MTGRPKTTTVPSRFNGPERSGNGGYSSGLFAACLDGPATVSLRSPVPMDTPLELTREEGAVRVAVGDAVVAEVSPAPPVEATVPAVVGAEQARRAAARYRAPADGLFAHCFVCGRARGEDCLEVFAGEVDDDSMVASPWTPPPWCAGEDGTVRAEFVWAVLDCPTYFAVHIGAELTMSFQVRQSVTVHAPVRVDEEHVAIAWPIEAEGRKREAGAALLSAAGDVLASGRTLLVEARSA